MPQIVLFNLSDYRPLSTKVLARSLGKAGIDCSVLDFSDFARKIISPKKGFYNSNKFSDFVEAVKKDINRESNTLSSTRFFGISFYDWEAERSITIPIARFLKQRFPNALLIGGGPAFNTNPKGYFSAAKLDYAIAGEAEKALPALVKAVLASDSKALHNVDGLVYRSGKRIILPQKKAMLSFEEIRGSPAIFSLESKGRVVTYSERGCGNACVFCSVPRRGMPVALADETIISAINELAKNDYIKEIHFADDQLFFNKDRISRVFGRIIELGLNKRFRFSGLATIDSFLKDGKVDYQFINFLKRANFSHLAVGTESLNDAVLRELKGGRYTSVQAIKVNSALKSAGIKTAHFMLAGGIETRAKDFLESYYRGLVKSYRLSGEYAYPSIVQAFRGSAFYEKARKEGALFTQMGRPFKETKKPSITTAFVVPKDPLLREVFLEKMRKGGKNFPEGDLKRMIKLSKKLDSLGQNSEGMTRRLQRQFGNEEIIYRERGNTFYNFYLNFLSNEMKKRGLKINHRNHMKLIRESGVEQRLFDQARLAARKYASARATAEGLKGKSRLMQVRKMRQKFGVGMTLPGRFKVK